MDTDFGDVAIATVALTGEGFSLPEIEDAAKRLRDRLHALDGVAAVTLHGEQREVITLEIARDRLAAVGTTLDALVGALSGQNVTLPAGSIVTGDRRMPPETTGEVLSRSPASSSTTRSS